MAELSKRQRETVTILSTLLRLAEAMDRGHLAEVAEIRCALENRGESLVVEILSEKECHLELWGLENQKNAIREVFNKRLDARCTRLTG
jgi:exopolyphosphatase/guanosine-5'-triphosphate,3'-diphosphate pyrophosphatase